MLTDSGALPFFFLFILHVCVDAPMLAALASSSFSGPDLSNQICIIRLNNNYKIKKW